MRLSFYTPCYVEVRNSSLSTAWLACGLATLATNLLLLLGQYGYVQHQVPTIDVLFWQDYSTDGSWWPSLPEKEPSPFCGTAYLHTDEDDGSRWGREAIGCVRTKDSRALLFYPASNEVRAAFSIAYSDGEGSHPQYNTSDVWIYEGIEHSTIAFHPSLATVREAIEHVPHCKAYGANGEVIPSRYEDLYASRPYGDGVLLLSVADIVAAAGKRLDELGADGAPLRLAGLELIAHVDIRNYEVPFRWPFTWNPLGWRTAAQLECTVRFSVLREHFTPIQWFFDREAPVALQHGLRLQVAATGSVGYFSMETLLTKLLLAFTAFSVAQSLLDVAWYYVYPHSRLIAGRAYQPLDMVSEIRRETADGRQAPPPGQSADGHPAGAGAAAAAAAAAAQPPLVARKSSGSLRSISIACPSPAAGPPAGASGMHRRRTRSPSPATKRTHAAARTTRSTVSPTAVRIKGE